MKAHSFAKWLVRNHVNDDSAVGELARLLREDYVFPATGLRETLRVYLYERGASDELLSTFDAAWSAWKHVICMAPGCGERRADGAHCAAHTYRRGL